MPENVVLRNRVIERRRMRPAEILPHPSNWRRHPQTQVDALRDILAEIGVVGELYAYFSERHGGRLTLLDGHLRSEEFGDQEWDIAVTDLTDEEADKLILTYDPLGAQATADQEKLAALLQTVRFESVAVTALVRGLAPPEVTCSKEPPTPPEQFPTYDEDLDTAYCCPKCGYEWSGKPK
jgi:hypothetical protein